MNIKCDRDLAFVRDLPTRAARCYFRVLRLCSVWASSLVQTLPRMFSEWGTERISGTEYAPNLGSFIGIGVCRKVEVIISAPIRRSERVVCTAQTLFLPLCVRFSIGKVERNLVRRVGKLLTSTGEL